MRPHDDIGQPDPDEVLHHIRESQQRWQATAEKLARQRDHYIDETARLEEENYELRRAARAYLDHIERPDWDPAGRHYSDVRANLDAVLNPPVREPDGDSQVTVPRG